MSKYVVKDNALINASYNLQVTEQRLMLLSIVNARETGLGITADTKLEIHAEEYAKQFNVTLSQAYKALKNAVNNLFERKFSYETLHKMTNKKKIVKSRWVSSIAYVDDLALLEITFAPDVVPLITRLEEQFTGYELIQVSQLSSKYAIRLYELLISWRKVGKTTELELLNFRKKLGVEDNEYQRIELFKRRVLEPAVKQINQLTDITVNYEQHKRGRTITGFSFSFKQKNPHQVRPGSLRNENTIDIFTGLTEKQINFFAHKLAYDSDFSNQYAEIGEEYIDLEQRLVKKLADEKFVKKISNDLIRLGFK